MENPILISQPQQLSQLGPSELLLKPEVWLEERPDAHWILVDRDGAPQGRCSLWWRDVPPSPGQRIGLIGHFAAQTTQASTRLLAHATAELTRRGATLAVGPMDGNTWRRYRFVTDRGAHPPFFLEPSHPPEWPEFWRAAGFQTLTEYHSRLNSDLNKEDPRAAEAGHRLRAAGVCLRCLRLDEFETELRRLYDLIVTAFRGSLLYTPLPLETFLAQYRKVEPLLRPELVTIAEHADQPVGLIFSVPDVLQQTRGQVVDTAIIKTLAIRPAREYAGLGSYLAACNQAMARDLGYRQVIHALMHQGSKSHNISARYGPVMRRYALFAKVL